MDSHQHVSCSCDLSNPQRPSQPPNPTYKEYDLQNIVAARQAYLLNPPPPQNSSIRLYNPPRSQPTKCGIPHRHEEGFISYHAEATDWNLPLMAQDPSVRGNSRLAFDNRPDPPAVVPRTISLPSDFGSAGFPSQPSYPATATGPVRSYGSVSGHFGEQRQLGGSNSMSYSFGGPSSDHSNPTHPQHQYPPRGMFDPNERSYPTYYSSQQDHTVDSEEQVYVPGPADRGYDIAAQSLPSQDPNLAGYPVGNFYSPSAYGSGGGQIIHHGYYPAPSGDDDSNPQPPQTAPRSTQPPDFTR